MPVEQQDGKLHNHPNQNLYSNRNCNTRKNIQSHNINEVIRIKKADAE